MSKSSLAQVSSEELSRLYHEQGLTTKEIGQRFGVSEDVVQYRMKQLGIPRRHKSEAAKGPRPNARSLRLSCEELKRLYLIEGLDTPEIGRQYGVDGATVCTHLEECGIARRDKSAAAIRYPRQNFSGDPLEKAYLLGFRQGDLWVKPTSDGPFSASITVTCTTTHEVQIRLFQELFTPYGHVAVTPAVRGNFVVGCHLNRSFDFLLPKQDSIPGWIVEDRARFIEFLAGYTDAEGCFCMPADRMAIFRLQSYDVNILHQIHARLIQFGVECPVPRLAIHKGYRNSGGYSLRQDCWSLTVKRKLALSRLCALLEPSLKHSTRRQDLSAVRRNVIERGIKENERDD